MIETKRDPEELEQTMSRVIEEVSENVEGEASHRDQSGSKQEIHQQYMSPSGVAHGAKKKATVGAHENAF